MEYVFVSYSHEDSDFVKVLKHELEAKGFEIWIDDERLSVGDDWREGIDEAIKRSFALIVVMSPDAKASEYVTYEWAYAWGRGIGIIPILLKETRLHPRLESLQYLEFTSRKNRPWDDLVDKLEQLDSNIVQKTIRVSRNAPQDVKRAVNALDSWNPQERITALLQLSEMDNSYAFQAIVSTYNHHPRDDVKIYALWYLGSRMHIEGVENNLMQIARFGIKTDGSIHNAAIRKFVRQDFSEDDFIGLQRNRLTGLDELVTRDKWLSITNMHLSPNDRKIDTQRSTEVFIRTSAMRLLSNYKSDSLVSLFHELANDEIVEVREAAVEYIVEHHNDESIELLLKIINRRRDNSLRVRAIQSLAKLKPDLIIQLLSTHSNDDDAIITTIVNNISNTTVNDEVLKLLDSQSFLVRIETIKLFGKTKYEPAIEVLINKLHSDVDLDMSITIVKSLAMIDTEQSTNALIDCLLYTQQFEVKLSERYGMDILDDRRLRHAVGEQIIACTNIDISRLVDGLGISQSDKPYWWWYVEDTIIYVLETLGTSASLEAVTKWRKKQSKGN